MTVQPLDITTVPEKFLSPIMFDQTREGVTARREFSDWLKTNKVYYYARAEEEFSAHEGYCLAEKAGCLTVWLEKL